MRNILILLLFKLIMIKEVNKMKDIEVVTIDGEDYLIIKEVKHEDIS